MTFTEKTIEEFISLGGDEKYLYEGEVKTLPTDKHLLRTNYDDAPDNYPENPYELDPEKVAEFIKSKLAKQKEEILKALPEEWGEDSVDSESRSFWITSAWNSCIAQVREAIEKV